MRPAQGQVSKGETQPRAVWQRQERCVTFWKSSSHGDRRAAVSNWCEGCLGGLSEVVTATLRIYGKDRQATRPGRLAEPYLESLAYVFQVLYTH